MITRISLPLRGPDLSEAPAFGRVILLLDNDDRVDLVRPAILFLDRLSLVTDMAGTARDIFLPCWLTSLNIACTAYNMVYQYQIPVHFHFIFYSAYKHTITFILAVYLGCLAYLRIRYLSN